MPYEMLPEPAPQRKGFEEQFAFLDALVAGGPDPSLVELRSNFTVTWSTT